MWWLRAVRVVASILSVLSLEAKSVRFGGGELLR